MTMILTLPEEMMTFLETQAIREGHASAEASLLALIRDAQRQQARRVLEVMLREGLEGRAVEMTHDDWQSIRREALVDLPEGDVSE